MVFSGYVLEFGILVFIILFYKIIVGKVFGVDLVLFMGNGFGIFGIVGCVFKM